MRRESLLISGRVGIGRLRKNYCGIQNTRWPAGHGRHMHISGCSKRLNFSPTQPRRVFHPFALSLPRQTLRPGTRLCPNKAAAIYSILRGGWDDPNCAQRSHPPTHWHAETCHLPCRGPSDFPYFAFRRAARLSFTARIERAPFYRARSASTKDSLAALLPSFGGRALREQRDRPSYPAPFFSILRVRGL